ncbi:uncharacterized protein DUF3347 [Mucilaginibacter gracilis]|uniref:DUF3347 domain-containing protein n=2 Tax=Mucilaginibacter TaxID=423349 RepID=H1YH10_9SPHI|nr:MULTISPECIES: DUF3347 domain-containing protein [Mucilaginibacter]EHQ27419.1 hypothetical protein Mucpa_3317 [Mucilaginibacter paludis DSM 18603]RKR80987.1 uncharacterized protein DUF3347 [Mucilaginibacter gracilis]
MKTLKTTALFLAMAVLSILTVKAQNAQTKPINTVITNYLSLKDALVSGDGTVAEAKAKTLLASIGEVPKTGLSADEAALLPKLEFDSRHISEVNKIDHQREHFASLSNNLYTLVKKLKVNNSVLYRQYCTMTKRYFLSDSDKGKDPYMGMANCSKVTETLPAAKK